MGGFRIILIARSVHAASDRPYSQTFDYVNMEIPCDANLINQIWSLKRQDFLFFDETIIRRNSRLWGDTPFGEVLMCLLSSVTQRARSRCRYARARIISDVYCLLNIRKRTRSNADRDKLPQIYYDVIHNPLLVWVWIRRSPLLSIRNEVVLHYWKPVTQFVELTRGEIL